MSSSSRCLKLLSQCKNTIQLKQAHALTITSGLGTNPFALSRLIAFCSHPLHGSLPYALKIFAQIQTPTLCIHNTLIKSFLLKHQFPDAIETYKLILTNGLFPDNYTFPYALKACAEIDEGFNLGKSVHCHALKLGLGFDNFVGNGLISLYSNFGEMADANSAFDEISSPCFISSTVLIWGFGKIGDVWSARLAFDRIEDKDRGIWGAMISVYVQNNCFKEGLGLFRVMQIDGIVPDEGCFVSVLSACAHLGCLEIGKWVHKYIKKLGIRSSVKLGNALINMYSKCGCICYAKKVFDEMPARDIVTWNAMIGGLATNAAGEKAVALFSTMEESGVRPDRLTFLSLLAACVYSDMAIEGLKLVGIMRNVYGVEPGIEHVGCIVDLLSRARLVGEANDLMFRRMLGRSVPAVEAAGWRALMSACCGDGEVSMAEAAAERVVALERDSGAYVLLSNAYAAAGRHGEARRVRRTMRRRGVEKRPGCSSTEIDGVVHEFVAGEKTHCNMDRICVVLEAIKNHLECFEDSKCVLSTNLCSV
ncbi:pentatricopeptide repeat-containing protein At2g20540-like [Andrographis paniculata]|uniref:pentatricopeptide repeat-containing protein At2g20540-like n=1 Tax=Andrographis paniculata TaxID=175694 RepID=UPI0021E91B10|nr:pentatricopeptide repeat-containing protein At2g20540-like [Andrographis paniculata]